MTMLTFLEASTVVDFLVLLPHLEHHILELVILERLTQLLERHADRDTLRNGIGRTDIITHDVHFASETKQELVERKTKGDEFGLFGTFKSTWLERVAGIRPIRQNLCGITCEEIEEEEVEDDDEDDESVKLW